MRENNSKGPQVPFGAKLSVYRAKGGIYASLEDLYVGKQAVKFNIPEAAEAVDRLKDLIREQGKVGGTGRAPSVGGSKRLEIESSYKSRVNNSTLQVQHPNVNSPAECRVVKTGG